LGYSGVMMSHDAVNRRTCLGTQQNAKDKQEFIHCEMKAGLLADGRKV